MRALISECKLAVLLIHETKARSLQAKREAWPRASRTDVPPIRKTWEAAPRADVVL